MARDVKQVREIVRADKTPNKRYHHQVGYIVGEDMIGIDSTQVYVQVVWLTRPSVTGDRRQTMPRNYLTTIARMDPDAVILEEPSLWSV